MGARLTKVYFWVWGIQFGLSLFSFGLYGVTITLFPIELLLNYNLSKLPELMTFIVSLALSINLWHLSILAIKDEEKYLFE